MMKNLLCLFLLIGVLFGTRVSAQPEMDMTFGWGGKIVLSFGSIGGTADLLTQPDDKIVLVGPCTSINFGSFPFCAIRLNSNGSFDTSFNGGGTMTNGYVFTAIPGLSSGQASVRGVALQSDGKIIAVGYGTSSGQIRAVVLRYNANGSLDQTFGTSGFIITSFGSGDTQASRVVVQPDGRIVVVGFVNVSSNSQQFVTRYLPSGAPDISFGTDGTKIISTSNVFTNGLSVTLQPDGKILTGGATGDAFNAPNPTASYLVARLDANGALDATFDGDGLKSIVYGTIFANEYGLRSLAVQSDGRILAIGHGNALFRFDANGALDASFDGDGTRQALSSSSNSYAVTVTPSGKITAVGYPIIPYNAPIDYRTARYLPNGAPDASYSDDGFLEIDAGQSLNDAATVVIADSKGRIVIARYSGTGRAIVPFERSQFSVVRLLAAPARNVGFAGRAVQSNGRPIVNATVTLKNGIQTIGTARTNPFGYFRIRSVQSGQTYTLSVKAKNLVFNDRSVLVDDEITNFNVFGARP